MANLQIKDLTSVTPTTADFIPLSNSGNTRKATLQDIRGVVNDITTGGVDKSLSAEMGKNIGIEITNARDGETDLDTRLDRDNTNIVTKDLESTGYGVVSGGVTTAQSTPNMTVNVTTSIIHMSDGTRLTSVGNNTLAITTADITNQRKDIIYAKTDNTIGYLVGVPASSPIAPSLPVGAILLSEINVLANTTSITNANIVDKRKMKNTTDSNAVKIGVLTTDLSDKVNQSDLDDTNEAVVEHSNKFLNINSPYIKNFEIDNFIDTRNWYPTTDLGVKNSDWVVTNNTLKINSANESNNLWNNKKLQDGKISLVWENPIISNANLTSVGIMFRGNSYNSYFAVSLYAGNYNSNSNKVILWKNINGSSTTLSTVILSTGDAILSDNIPVNFEVEFYGSIINVFVNGKKVLTYNETNIYNKGMCGLNIPPTSLVGNTDTQISNFIIEEYVYNNTNLSFENILAIGDSIMFGQGASTANKAWIPLFANKVTPIISNFNVTNIAVGGQTTTQVLATFATHINANPNKYKMIIISCGTNNARSDVRVSVVDTVNNICSMIKIAKNIGAIPILCIPPNCVYNIATLDPIHYGSDSYSYFTKLVQSIKNVGIAEKIRVCDNYSVLNNDSTKLADGVHPNDVGYAILADNLFNTIFNEL